MRWVKVRTWSRGRAVWGVELAAAKCLDEEERDGDEDGEEVGDVDGVAQDDADDDDGEGLPVGDLVWRWDWPGCSG